MPETPQIRISVIHVEADRVFSIDLALPEGSTIADAIQQSGIRKAIPGIDIREDRLGVFARKASPDTVLRDGDRVEIYRPLTIDPKDARRRRARDK